MSESIWEVWLGADAELYLVLYDDCFDLRDPGADDIAEPYEYLGDL